MGVERGSQQSQTQIQIVNEDVEEIMLQYGTASRCVATKVIWKEPYIFILINFLFDPGFPSYKKILAYGLFSPTGHMKTNLTISVESTED